MWAWSKTQVGFVHPIYAMTVLMLGRHIELGHYRAEFLKTHGIDVIFPENKRQACQAIAKGGFDAVIISYSLSDDTVKELTELIEQHCPNCPIISITEQRWNDRALKPNATVLATDPPQALLDTLRRVNTAKQEGIRRVK